MLGSALMQAEYLPASGAAQQELVLLHGWGSNREIWRPLLVHLRPWANITLLDIPGCSPDSRAVANPQLEATLAGILAAAPARAVFVGWSLGAQLAQELALRHPERVLALVGICSNPRFVAANDWPGMAPDAFADFQAAVDSDPVAGLRRFDSLQVAGARHERQLLRMLRRRDSRPAAAPLACGLRWLQALDGRRSLPSLGRPQLHLHAARDALVPVAVHREMGRLLSGTPDAQLGLLPQASHVAPLDCPEALGALIRDFLAASALLRPQQERAVPFAKRDVAESFSRAAGNYDSVASLQRDVGRQLLNNLDGLSPKPSTVLDLGCGTGYFSAALRRRYPDARYIGLDLAQGMVEYARTRCSEEALWLVGDAEALPLATSSVDLVFSSLAVQWCHRPRHLFAELARVLRPGGCCVFTSLGPDTLCELRSSWAAVDKHQHVNTFLPAADLVAAADQVPGIRLRLANECFVMQYQRVRDLLGELKTLGAHNMNRDRPAGLTSRAGLQGMLRAYESWREAGRLPATYDVIFGMVEVA